MEKAFGILKRINEKGYMAYLVGGSVRDYLMGRKPMDFDISTNALPNEIREIFSSTKDKSAEKGTITVIEEDQSFEITTFRVDGKYIDGRRPQSVNFINDLNTDLARRDFTINAIALDANGNLIDPYEGKKHISEKIIKAVGDPDERFSEDALRMIRAVRLSCQLGFKIEDATLKAIKNNRKAISKISRERLTDEIIKMVNTRHVENIDFLYTSGIAGQISRSAKPFDTSILKRVPPRYNYRLYAFVNLSLIGPDYLSLSKANIENYSTYFMTIENNRVFLKQMLQKYSPEIMIKILFFRSYFEDSDFYLRALEQVQDILKYKEPYELRHLAINGEDLIEEGISDGVEIGKILDSILDIVMIHPEKNKKDVLIEIVRGQAY